MKPEILDRQIVHGGYLTVERLRMRLTDGAEVSREVERHGDAAAVLPYDVERRSALVVRLFRASVLEASGEEMSEEACAGMIENEDADTTARREAYEELGVDLPSLEFVARVWSSPGVSTERQSLFLAPFRSADRISDGGGVEGEHEGNHRCRAAARRARGRCRSRTDLRRKATDSGTCATPAAARPLCLGYFFPLLLFALTQLRKKLIHIVMRRDGPPEPPLSRFEGLRWSVMPPRLFETTTLDFHDGWEA
jgi:nudix-type nucleoside diphosphatase (YffH/AdpP family)